MSDAPEDQNLEGIKVGDVVWLKSGSQPMTVEEIGSFEHIEPDGEAFCVWHISGKHQEHSYRLSMLTKTPPTY